MDDSLGNEVHNDLCFEQVEFTNNIVTTSQFIWYIGLGVGHNDWALGFQR